MEIYPIYEQNTEIAPNLWYSLSGQGESPCMRVGHSIVQVKDENNKHDKGKLCIVGGANPSELFSDIYMFDLENLSWDRFDDFEQFKPGRYEHACIYEKKEKNIFIYGGCTETGNCNDVFKVDLEKKTCESVICKNSAPTARTIHSGVMYKNQLVIFGGGAATKTPVPDQNVYIFDPPSYKWISLNISKDSKTPITRQGHLLINYNDQLIILHGGLNENELFDDLWSVDFNKMEWKEIFFSKEESRFPLKRAAHGGVSINNNIYIFGGIGPDNAALDDLWKFDLDNNQWSIIEIFGFKPPPRLDFAYCKATFSKPYSNIESKEVVNELSEINDLEPKHFNSSTKETLYNFLVIHGGMDTSGNIFDDIFLINLI